MLLQSYQGFVEIFPAVPNSWATVSFDQLRTEGAFLVSASKQNGQVKTVTIKAEKDGILLLKNPFSATDKYSVIVSGAVQKNPDQEEVMMMCCWTLGLVQCRVVGILCSCLLVHRLFLR